MPIAPLLLALTLAQVQGVAQGATPRSVSSQETLTASGLISKMFAKYSGAKSLSATIKTTQAAGGFTVSTDTSVAYERPSKLRLDQHQKGASIDRTVFLASDGQQFAYTPPRRVLNSAPFLLEPVQPEGRAAQKVGDLYTVVAADLPDRSPALDALIARTDDLQYFANQLVDFKLTGKEAIDGKSLNVIEGDWRESPQFAKGGRFRMHLTDEGDLVRYQIVQNFSTPITSGRNTTPTPAEQVVVTTTWEVKVALNPVVPASAFILKP